MKLALLLADSTIGPTVEGPDGFNIDAAYTAPIPPGSRWIECPLDIQPGDSYINDEWVRAPRPVQPLTQLEFLRRFTAQERIAIRASTDPVILDFMHLLNLAQDVKTDDPDTVAAVQYLEAIGLIGAGRGAEILA